MQTAAADQNYLKLSERRSLWNEHSLGKKKNWKRESLHKVQHTWPEWLLRSKSSK